jgi:hypothetical protein
MPSGEERSSSKFFNYLGFRRPGRWLVHTPFEGAGERLPHPSRFSKGGNSYSWQTPVGTGSLQVRQVRLQLLQAESLRGLFVAVQVVIA